MKRKVLFIIQISAKTLEEIKWLGLVLKSPLNDTEAALEVPDWMDAISRYILDFHFDMNSESSQEFYYNEELNWKEWMF